MHWLLEDGPDLNGATPNIYSIERYSAILTQTIEAVNSLLQLSASAPADFRATSALELLTSGGTVSSLTSS